MAHPSADWYQMQLVPPEVVEFRLRLGVVESADHVQWMVEAFEPTSGAQIAMRSGPHASYTRLHEALAVALTEFRVLVQEHCHPF